MENNKFNFKDAMDKLNLFKNAAEFGLNLQDKSMDVCDKHFEGSKIIIESKKQELTTLIQEKGKELIMLKDIKDLNELHEKKQKIYDFYNPKISEIESELKHCDNEKMDNSEKIKNNGIKIFAALLLGTGTVGYGVAKSIEHSHNESVLESSVGYDDYKEVLDDEKYTQEDYEE